MPPMSTGATASTASPCLLHVPLPLQVKLVDAGFMWTEPHSRRIKVKLTVQAEVMNGAILQQTFVVEYVVEPHMCMDCTRANTNTSVWTACAQVWGLHCRFSSQCLHADTLRQLVLLFLVHVLIDMDCLRHEVSTTPPAEV